MIKSRLLLPAVTAAALTLVSAISFARAHEARAGDLAIVSAWARATPPGAKVGAGYVTVENRGDAADRIVAVTSPAAATVELHQTVEENGMAKMRPLEDSAIPPGGRLEMRPGGIHMMLMDLTAPLKQGEALAVAITFEKAGAVTLELPIQPIGADAPAGGHDHAM